MSLEARIFIATYVLFWSPYICVWILLGIIAASFRRLYREGRGPSSRTFYLRSTKIAINWIDDLHNYVLLKEDSMSQIHGLKSDQIQDIVLDSQEKDPVESQIVWKIKYLDVRAHASITDSIYSATGFGKKREEQLRAGTQTLEILRKGLRGWKNFKFPDGKDVPWDAFPADGSKQVIDSYG